MEPHSEWLKRAKLLVYISTMLSRSKQQIKSATIIEEHVSSNAVAERRLDIAQKLLQNRKIGHKITGCMCKQQKNTISILSTVCYMQEEEGSQN